MIRPYLSDMISDHKTQEEWKIQLSMTINFISSKYSDEIRIMHTKIENYYSENITMSSDTDEIIKELFKSLLQRYQEGLEESMKESVFIFDSVDSFITMEHFIVINAQTVNLNLAICHSKIIN